MPLYQAYGLSVQSDLPLPELMPVDGVPRPADVTVKYGKVDVPPSPTARPSDFTYATAEETYLVWGRVGRFLVRGGTTITFDRNPDGDERQSRLALLGPVLAILLRQRGLLVLHASAVAMQGHAVVFVGRAGQGKSSMAAALHAAGHGIVADDAVAIGGEDGAPPVVYPAFPQLKLNLDVATLCFGARAETLPTIGPEVEKHSVWDATGFPSAALPLSRVYVLSRGSHTEIQELPLPEALMELLRHTYAVQTLMQSSTAPSHLVLCSQLVKHKVVFRLCRPRSLSALPELAGLIERETYLAAVPSNLAHA